MVTVRPHALTHPVRPEHMAGQVPGYEPSALPLRESFYFYNTRALCSPMPWAAFVFSEHAPHPSARLNGATAGDRLRLNLPPNSTPQAPDQARYMREARHTRRTASGANNYYLSSRITLLQPPGDDRRLQQKIALTTRRTTASTTRTTATLTSYKHNISGCSSVPQFSAKLPQLATPVSLLHPAVASSSLQPAYDSSTPARRLHCRNWGDAVEIKFSVMQWGQHELKTATDETMAAATAKSLSYRLLF
jgi:hypothetical protein